LFELAALRESLGQPMEAAEALLETIRISGAEDDVSDALTSIDRLSATARERTLLTRAHGAAAAREGLQHLERARHLNELAAILEELGDLDSANAARQEAEASRDDRPPIRIIDPFTSFEPDPSARAMANAAESDWSQAVELTAMDTLIDRALTDAERLRIQRASESATEIKGGWEISDAPRERLDSVRILPPLGNVDESAATPPATPKPEMVEASPPAIDAPLEEPEIIDPVEEIRAALRLGELDDALGKLAARVIDGEDADAKIWIDAGNLARAFGRIEDAERCFLRADAGRALAEIYIAQGALREAASALITKVDAARSALDLARIGQLFLKDGDLFLAAGWLDDALNEDPACADAAIGLVGIFAAREDRTAVAELAARVERAQLAMAQRARWLTALGEAKRTLGDRSGARDSLALALVSDPLLIDPAESLIALGREANQAEWIDDGLRELRTRALARGSRSRGFLASALLVARGAAHEDDRATYESLRLALPSKPRAPIDARALLAALSSPLTPAAAEPADPAPIARDVRFESAALREVIDTLEASLAGAPVAVSALGLGEELAKKELKKSIFFDVARRYLAAQGPSSPGNVLDRAVLVILQDPLIALETVGIGTSRAEDLIAFAASPELPRLWSQHGLGLEPRTPIAKGESRV
jgi:hypothetical protein